MLPKIENGGSPGFDYAAAKSLMNKLNGLTREEARQERNSLELKRRELASEYHDRLGDGTSPTDEDHEWAKKARVDLDGYEKDIKDLDAALSLGSIIKQRDPATENQKRAMLAYASPGQGRLLAEAEKDGSVMHADEIEDLTAGAIPAVRVYPVNNGTIIIHGRADEELLKKVPGGADIINVAAVTRDDASIGELLPTGASSTILERLVQYGDLGNLTARMTTPNGNPIIMSGVDDTAQKGRRMGKTGNAQTPTDPTFAEVELDAWIYTSDPLPVRQDALTDAPFALGMVLEHLMAVRIARAEGEELTNGTGNDQPQGITKVVTEKALQNGQTPAKTTAFDAQDLSIIRQTIDPAYLKAGMVSALTPGMGRVGWMIAHGAEGVLRAMKDGDGRPLWLPNIREGDPEMIYGYPYHVNTSMDDPAAGKVPMLFGHFGYYMIRRVDGVVVRRWDDSYFGKDNKVAFQGFSRCDGRAIGGWDGSTTTTTKAIIGMKMAAN